MTTSAREQAARPTTAPPLRTNLKAGAATDPLERDADEIADRVMRTPDPGLSVLPCCPRGCPDHGAQTQSRVPPVVAATRGGATREAGAHDPVLTGLATAVREQTRLPTMPRVHAKLEVSHPDDPEEQEAERLAAAVMRMAAPDACDEEIQSDPGTPAVQRACKACGDELRRQPLEEEDEDEEILRAAPQARGAVPAVTPAIASSIRTLQGSGDPLPSQALAFFQPRFGVDLSDVRVHTSSGAAEAARALKARAFTTGHDIVFGSGQYVPDAASGRRLLAHELAHVLQQRGVQKSSPLLSKAVQRQEDESTREGSNVSDALFLSEGAGDALDRLVRTGFYEECVELASDFQLAVEGIEAHLSSQFSHVVDANVGSELAFGADTVREFFELLGEAASRPDVTESDEEQPSETYDAEYAQMIDDLYGFTRAEVDILLAYAAIWDAVLLRNVLIMVAAFVEVYNRALAELTLRALRDNLEAKLRALAAALAEAGRNVYEAWAQTAIDLLLPTITLALVSIGIMNPIIAALVVAGAAIGIDYFLGPDTGVMGAMSNLKSGADGLREAGKEAAEELQRNPEILQRAAVGLKKTEPDLFEALDTGYRYIRNSSELVMSSKVGRVTGTAGKVYSKWAPGLGAVFDAYEVKTADIQYAEAIRTNAQEVDRARAEFVAKYDEAKSMLQRSLALVGAMVKPADELTTIVEDLYDYIQELKAMQAR
jgi:hypothetical protein